MSDPKPSSPNRNNKTGAAPMATKARTAPTTCTVDTAALLGLLTDIARTASTDDVMPMINGVLLHTASHDKTPVLVATSTDRFHLGQAHIECTGGIPESFVRLDDIKRLIAVLKPLAHGESLLEISAADNALAFNVDGMAMTLPTSEELPKWPKIGPLFSTDRNSAEQHTAIAPRLMATMTAVAKARGESLRIQFQGANRPVIVLIGDAYRALVMPVRVSDRQADVPVFVPPAEQAALAAEAKRKAAAERAAARKAAKEAAAAETKPTAKPAARKTTARKPAATTRRPVARKKAAA